ncbi:MAG: cysteine desulfurase NifS [Clostridia bacterium]|nr:cysteine desulfurase NifS [Clostridia bacterium]
MKAPIYLDYASTTPLGEAAAEAMRPWLGERFGNPSSVHRRGREAQTAIGRARKQVAAAIGADASEIFFTSGGTESDNWAIWGTALGNRDRGNHIITTAIEHHAVLNPCRWLEKNGFDVTYLPVDGEGFVSPKQVREALTDRTVLISVMTANNEIGTLEPAEEIGRIAREHRICFHTDAVQAVGAIPIDVRSIGADLMSLSGHKLHGPQGIGALYIRTGVRIDPLLRGGAQERGLRAGTENVAAIAGLGAAMAESVHALPERSARVAALRDRLIRGVLENVPGSRLNGPREKRLPGNASFSFENIEGEALLLRLDLAGFCCSSGSACTSGSQEPSHVLEAIGLDREAAGGSLRVTLGAETTEEEIEALLEALPRTVAQLRQLRGI